MGETTKARGRSKKGVEAEIEQLRSQLDEAFKRIAERDVKLTRVTHTMRHLADWSAQYARDAERSKRRGHYDAGATASRDRMQSAAAWLANDLGIDDSVAPPEVVAYRKWWREQEELEAAVRAIGRFAHGLVQSRRAA